MRSLLAVIDFNNSNIQILINSLMEPKISPQKPKKVTYARLPEDTNADDDLDMPYVSSHSVARGEKPTTINNNLRKHEIYDNTYYIPNTKVRILETPMSSSLSF